ncbi:MAG: bifunctional phosphoribosyl-AMP cyclohydrolase/phosphoribosyl-ATP diphosphatase HisIE [Polyangiaceae bacterium]|nr:bifunctional phosphoribosyl-AMP cyclohydrolase/phosphoribosyl-ATP diphosphatase HisIE [Polyangiaceae bacterium]
MTLANSRTPSALRFDAQGLLTGVIQDPLTGEVRMVGHLSREALAQTLRTRLVTFFSRSRNRLWVKGESSGHHLSLHRALADCDSDALLLFAEPQGPTCHTGRDACFFRDLEGQGDEPSEASESAAPFLVTLERSLARRRDADAGRSYTKSLLEAGPRRIGEKIVEEAGELARALESEDDERVASEAADLLYHALVGLIARRVPLRAVLATLARRVGTSGHDEKRARSAKPGGEPSASLL